ncbi:MAG: hypothetical protein ACLTXH_12110 [Enterobacter hormaechei]
MLMCTMEVRLSAMLLPVWVVFLFIAFKLSRRYKTESRLPFLVFAPSPCGEGVRHDHHTVRLRARWHVSPTRPSPLS